MFCENGCKSPCVRVPWGNKDKELCEYQRECAGCGFRFAPFEFPEFANDIRVQLFCQQCAEHAALRELHKDGHSAGTIETFRKER